MNYQLYFSPTEGTKKAVNTVSSYMKADFQEVDFTELKVREKGLTCQEEDVLIAGFPVYGGRLPQVNGLLDHLHGHHTPCILCACYGNRHYDDALLELKDEMEKRGFCCIAAAAIVIPHVYSHILGAGRPDKEDEKEIKIFAEKIDEKLEMGRKISVDVPGNIPYKVWNKPERAPEKTDSCTGCGICRKVCPTAAIDENFIADPKICIQCMKCVRQCPAGGRIMDTSQQKAYLEGHYKEPRKNEWFL